MLLAAQYFSPPVFFQSGARSTVLTTSVSMYSWLQWRTIGTCRHLTCVFLVAILVVNVNTYASIFITYSLQYFLLL